MSNNKIFSSRAFREYIEWQAEDRKTLKKINELIKDIQRNSYEGLGHPEPLKGNLSGCWSREIDEKNRLVYRTTDSKDVEIIQCKGHYNDK
jgi:toxin YoeB